MLRNFLPVCLAAWSLVAFGVALTGCETKKPAPRTASNAPAPPTPSAEGAPTGTQGGTQAADAPTACQPGFEAKGGQCVDIDECSFVGSVCGTAQATCANKPGGYECTCPRGYAGGGPLGIACAPRIATGNAGTCVLPEGARMKCWGAPAGGVFAAEDNKIGSHEPEYLIDSESPVALALSARHGCLLRPDSTVACWGNNQHGQVGDGTTEMRFSPTAVKGLSGAIAIGVGYDFSCAVLKTGAFMCWGDPEQGGFGDKSAKKVLKPMVASVTDVASITINGSSSCAVLRTGKVLCWGANYYAQLGLGKISDAREKLAPTLVPQLDNVIQARLGDAYGMAIQKGGRMMWWGVDEVGTSEEPEETPSKTYGATPVTLSQPAIAVDVGYSYGCALTSAGEVWCQGKGNLGQSTTRESKQPVRVPELQAVALSINSQRACALAADGSTSCWGSNINKALGQASGLKSLSPVRLGPAYGWASPTAP